MPEPPGELVDVDGHQMHLYCSGEGGRTVLLEPGLGDSSLNFRELQEELATTTRVCTYDRAGNGWSEPGPEPRTGQQIVDELETLLATAGERGPYVLAGHSFGGLIALMFAEANPDDVAGVVLIDSYHPGQYEAPAVFTEVLAALDDEYITAVEALAVRAEAGTLDAEDMWRFAPLRLDLDLRAQWVALYLQPHSLRTIIAEDDALRQTMRQVGGAGSLENIPLVVLAAGLGLQESMSAYDRQQLGITLEEAERADVIWRELQEDHVNRSANVRLVVAEDSTHYIYFHEPEVVLEAIQELTGTE